jgi:hypothetical protein
MDTLVTLGIIAAIGVVGVLLPVGLSALEEFSTPKDVICPENGEPARITADAAYVAMTSAVGMNRFRLTGCSRWPERAGCNQSCLSRLAN